MILDIFHYNWVVYCTVKPTVTANSRWCPIPSHTLVGKSQGFMIGGRDKQGGASPKDFFFFLQTLSLTPTDDSVLLLILCSLDPIHLNRYGNSGIGTKNYLGGGGG